MKASSSCRLRLVFAGCLITALWATIPSKADTGGGGKIQTPYAEPDKVTEEMMVKVKAISARRRDATIPVDRPDFPPRARNLALVVAKRGRISGDPRYHFQGKDETGKPASADFSEVKDFKVIRFEKKDCLLEITLFPAITPRDLLERKPSYSELATNYTSLLRLWLQVDVADGDLAIAGEDWDGKREVVARLRDIKPNSKIDLMYGRLNREEVAGGTGDAIWFATYSVIQDTNYPHRLILRK